MSGLLRTAFSRMAPSLRGHNITQRANITSKPAKGNVGPVDTAIGLTMFSLAILAPAGWILAHLENYKKKE